MPPVINGRVLRIFSDIVHTLAVQGIGETEDCTSIKWSNSQPQLSPTEILVEREENASLSCHVYEQMFSKCIHQAHLHRWCSSISRFQGIYLEETPAFSVMTDTTLDVSNIDQMYVADKSGDGHASLRISQQAWHPCGKALFPFLWLRSMHACMGSAIVVAQRQNPNRFPTERYSLHPVTGSSVEHICRATLAVLQEDSQMGWQNTTFGHLEEILMFCTRQYTV
jgi:hypothetical protein